MEDLTADRDSALDSPHRRRVLQHVQLSEEPPTAAELAKNLGLHITTVRFHLEQLEQDGLVARDTSPSSGRGRPSLRYRLARMPAEDAHKLMMDALADAVTIDEPTAWGRAVLAGERWANKVDLPNDGQPQTAHQTIIEVFERIGFSPKPDGNQIKLTTCPFRDSARLNPDAICAIHLGLARGLATRVSPSTEISLHPFSSRHHCDLTLQNRKDTSHEPSFASSAS